MYSIVTNLTTYLTIQLDERNIQLQEKSATVRKSKKYKFRNAYHTVNS